MGYQDGEGNEYGEGAMVNETVPDESWEDESFHDFWRLGTSAIFDMQIVNLDVGSYLHKTSAKDLAMAEKDKKEKYC